MRPVYAMRLDGPVWPESTMARVRQLVTDWVEEEWPAEDRGAGVSIRFDNDDPSRWWRLTIDRGLAGNAVATTSITVATDRAATTFEARITLVPGGRRVVPAMPDVPLAPVQRIVARILDGVAFHDANLRVLPSVRVVADNSGAQALAAFCEARGRVLPVLIETVPTRSTPLFELDRHTASLAGLAHMYRLEGDAARTAFHGMYGAEILLARGLTLVWPGGESVQWGGTKLNQAGAASEVRTCIGRINFAAHGSLAPLRAPRFQRRLPDAPPVDVPAKVTPTPVAAAPVAKTVAPPAPTLVEPGVPMVEYKAALDGWQDAYNRIDELEQALAEADRTIDEKNQLLDNREGLVDQLVLQNTELAVRLGKSPTGLRAISALDAVKQAESICEHLTFHERAFDTAAQLEGIDANRLLEDLVRLNVVAGDWKSGRVTNASLTISCRSLGLNYASGISDNAENKYADDYAFTWRGRTEIAAAHIRNGRGSRLYRVHIFFDHEAHQVVVAYVGRHLRDKSTS